MGAGFPPHLAPSARQGKRCATAPWEQDAGTVRVPPAGGGRGRLSAPGDATVAGTGAARGPEKDAVLPRAAAGDQNGGGRTPGAAPAGAGAVLLPAPPPTADAPPRTGSPRPEPGRPQAGQRATSCSWMVSDSCDLYVTGLKTVESSSVPAIRCVGWVCWVWGGWCVCLVVELCVVGVFWGVVRLFGCAGWRCVVCARLRRVIGGRVPVWGGFWYVGGSGCGCVGFGVVGGLSVALPGVG